VSKPPKQSTLPNLKPDAPAWAKAAKPWDAASRLSVVRHTYVAEGEVIDRGVNFFVLTLEALGATPMYSCEGHPNGFYVFFKAPYELALRIEHPGFFALSLESRNHGPDHWAIRVTMPWHSEKDKKRTLRWAAEAWQKAFWTIPPTKA
jgi:hypothetical protein